MRGYREPQLVRSQRSNSPVYIIERPRRLRSCQLPVVVVGSGCGCGCRSVQNLIAVACCLVVRSSCSLDSYQSRVTQLRPRVYAPPTRSSLFVVENQPRLEFGTFQCSIPSVKVFSAAMSASPIARQVTQSQVIPSRRMLVTDPSQLPDVYSSTPGGTLYSTTPGGEFSMRKTGKNSYANKFLYECLFYACLQRQQTNEKKTGTRMSRLVRSRSFAYFII